MNFSSFSMLPQLATLLQSCSQLSFGVYLFHIRFIPTGGHVCTLLEHVYMMHDRLMCPRGHRLNDTQIIINTAV
jgi:hypothetical protein